MKKFDFLNQFRDAVFVVNNHFEIVYSNNTFEKIFKNYRKIKKLSHGMNFTICPLNSENIETYSPLYHAITSPQNFFACISFTFENGKKTGTAGDGTSPPPAIGFPLPCLRRNACLRKFYSMPTEFSFRAYENPAA